MNKAELLTKLREAETGSPELSVEVFKYLNPEYEDWVYEFNEIYGKHLFFHPLSWNNPVEVLPLTQSIDTAVKAVEEKGLYVTTETGPDKLQTATVYELFLEIIEKAIHKWLPIAICIALVEATEEGKT